jgi:class 3 adenylate cyclase
MRSRKIYNNERIVEVEIRHTEELLYKLVPEHALTGIKNDQKVMDVLENVTILYSNLVGFKEYYKAVKKP